MIGKEQSTTLFFRVTKCKDKLEEGNQEDSIQYDPISKTYRTSHYLNASTEESDTSTWVNPYLRVWQLSNSRFWEIASNGPPFDGFLDREKYSHKEKQLKENSKKFKKQESQQASLVCVIRSTKDFIPIDGRICNIHGGIKWNRGRFIGSNTFVGNKDTRYQRN